MDCVFFIIKDQEIYVADYHKGELKQIKFKEQDSWEVYDRFDFAELIEYMNYPLNYNRFKGSRVQVLLAKPEDYVMVYENRGLFSESEGVSVGALEDALLRYYKQEDHCVGQLQKISYEGSVYMLDEALTSIQYVCTKEEEEDSVQDITTLALCDFQKERVLTPLGEHCLVLSPNKIEKCFQGSEHYLETHYVIDSSSVCKDGKTKTGDQLFAYHKHVQSFFKRQTKECLQKCSPTEGHYFYMRRESDEKDTIWAEKGQLIGVIGASDDTRETMEAWLGKIGYHTCN